MKIAINSLSELPYVFKEIELLTSGAKVDLKKIQFDQINKVVTIPINRKNIFGYKNNLFSSTLKPIYKNETKESILVIKAVNDFTIENSCNNPLKELTILIGVKIDLNEIYISSAEEIMGETLCEVKIKVDEINIELYDI